MKAIFLLLLTAAPVWAVSPEAEAKFWVKSLSTLETTGTAKPECADVEEKYRYPQCIEGISRKEVARTQCPEFSKVNCKDPKADPQVCAKQGYSCLKTEDQNSLPPNALEELIAIDPDGTRECLFYEGTDLIKMPHPNHWEAIARKKVMINELASSLGIPASSIACSLGADATLTRLLWKDQASLKNLMLKDKPAKKAISYLKTHKIHVPVMKDWKSEDAVIIKTAAILKEAELSYRENGLDISKRPEILATLYNIGASLEDGTYRAVGKSATYQPKPNFFGVFCQRYQAKYEALLKE